MVDFEYENLNPYGEKENDCIIRAIANATGLPYFDVEDKLFYVGKLLECDRRYLCCYSFLIDNVFGFEPVECYGLTLYEFADLHPKGVYLVRSNGHISVLDNYCVKDIWDCRDMVLTNAWRIV